MKKVNLFGSDDEIDTENISKIEINQDFAKRFEYNKKREDLQRLEELKKQGRVSDSNSDSESDSSDDEDVNLDDIKTLEFWNVLLLARNKDPILKQKDVKLFASSESSEEEEGEEKGQGQKNIVIGKEKGKKSKPKYLKDVNAEHLIEMGPEFGDREDEEEEGNAKKKKKVKSYSEEQEELRKEVLDALENAEIEAGNEGDFLKEKGGEKEDIEQLDQEVEKKLKEYFGEDEKLDKNEMFLKDYFMNKMWIDKEGKSSFDDDVLWFSEEEEEIERQERHEKEWNFRFEESTGDRVETHSRVIADSVRKKDNARKEQRKRKKERLEQAEIERQEEVKRLKNLKKREIMDKIYKIREVAGLGEEAIPLTEADLEEEFDPEEYDKKMNAAFGEEYYDAEDVDPEFGSGGSDLEKPDFEKEDELLGLSGSWDVYDKPGGVFLNEWEKYKEDNESKMDAVNNEQDQQQGGEEEEEEDLRQSKRKRKRKMSLKEKMAIDKDLEELYKLDYEDTIGDLKTRFKYKQVNPKRYGLHTEDILSIDDKELNQYVSIKKLAPYREKEWNVPINKRIEFKKKNKLAPHRENEWKDQHKNYKIGDHARSNTDATQDQEDNHVQVEQKTKSRKAKRRERNKYEISDTRKMAYGKIISKSKGKPKQ